MVDSPNWTDAISALPPLSQILDRNPLTVPADMSILEAIARMNQAIGTLCCLAADPAPLPAFSESASCVLVVKGAQPVGMLTERDIVRLTLTGIDLAQTPIAQAMTQPLVTLTLTPNTPLQSALTLLTQHRIRHLPIVDADGQLVGLVTHDHIRYVLEPANFLRLRQVAEVMNAPVICAASTDSVLSLAQQMVEHQISCIVVVENTAALQLKPIGILTERDIVQFQAIGLDLATTQVQTVMSSPLFTLRPTDSLWVANQEMQRLRVRRFGVVGEQGELLGLLTQTSLLRVFDLIEVATILEAMQQRIEADTRELKHLTQQLQTEAAQRCQTEASLQRTEQWLQQYSLQSPNAIYTMAQNLEGKVWLEYISAAVEAIFEVVPQQAIDHSEVILDQVHPADRANYWAAMSRSVQDLDLFSQEFRIVTPSGKLKWLYVQAKPEQRGDGTIAWHGMVQDISDRKQIELERDHLLAEAQAARAEAEAANRSKDEFVAMVAHELRSPLNATLGWVQLLRTRQFSAEMTAKALETIERNTLAQAQLVEDLLDVSRIVSSKLSISKAPVNLTEVVEAAIEQVRLQAEAKQISLIPQLTIPPLVSGDANRLQQIVVNLLTNAIKFTPEQGRVEIELGQIDDQVQLQVSDTGKGIAPEFVPYLFERYQQGQKNTSMKDGLGLGLTIVKTLVELHAGTIIAASLGLGQGATFTVRLPMLKTPAIAPRQTIAPISAAALADLRVLVVDDEPDMLHLIQFVLEEAGATVRSATSANQALALLPEFQPNILLSDIAMPDGTGYDLVEAVRRYEVAQNSLSVPRPIPAIALTAYASATYEERSLQAGFQRHLTKPVESKVLVAAILELAKLRE